MSLYDYSVKDRTGNEVSLEQYRGGAAGEVVLKR